MVALITSVVPGRATVTALSALAIVPNPSIPTNATNAMMRLIAVSLRRLLSSHRSSGAGTHRPDSPHPSAKDLRGALHGTRGWLCVIPRRRISRITAPGGHFDADDARPQYAGQPAAGCRRPR